MKTKLRPRPPLDGESGQVEAEAAIVLPAVVFLLLGLIQLGLMHQARIFAKYAAYRAVRTGALRAGNVELMEKAALAAALPILAYRNGNAEVLGKTDDATNWMRKWVRNGFGTMPSNRMMDVPYLKYAEVTICGPTQQDVSGFAYTDESGQQLAPFDHPKFSSGGIKSKLRVRLVLNYRLIIPFANWVIHRMWRGERITKELRLDARRLALPNSSVATKYRTAAAQGVFVIPIEAYYSMKMHSDIPLDRLPQSTPDGC
jgi:hypothetical protein